MVSPLVLYLLGKGKVSSEERLFREIVLDRKLEEIVCKGSLIKPNCLHVSNMFFEHNSYFMARAEHI